MTITIEPFAKLDAVCAGCGRSASVARICLPVARDRHVVCERCLADLHRLTGPVAPVLTVGAALAMPEVQRGEAVTESTLLCGFRQYRIDDGSLKTRIRSMDDGATWGPWRPTWVSMSEVVLACRLVSLADADRDPSERGAL